MRRADKIQNYEYKSTQVAATLHKFYLKSSKRKHEALITRTFGCRCLG